MVKIKMKRKLWAGFVGNHLDIIDVDAGWGGFGSGSFSKMPAVFTNQKDAKEKYQDVRQVEVELVICK